MNPTEQLAHFSGGTNDLSMTGLWYSHKRVAQLVDAAKAEALREARDAIHSDGPDADAIRDTLGLRWEGRIEPDAHGGIIDFMGQVRMIAKQPTIRRRVVSDWRTQP